MVWSLIKIPRKNFAISIMRCVTVAEEKLEDGSERVVMKLPPFLGPTKVEVYSIPFFSTPESTQMVSKIIRVIFSILL